MIYQQEMKNIQVLDKRMAYALQGSKGQSIVFVHGMPTSSFLWRKVMPVMADIATCYAPDLIGMGYSEKPEITYTTDEHIAYFSAWIEAMGLKNITLVMHGWGSIIGATYAANNPNNVKAIAFYESHIRPVEAPDMLALPVQELIYLMRDEQSAYQKIVEQNYLVERLLPDAIVSELTEQEMHAYRRPFRELKDRQVLLQYFKELPVGKNKSPVMKHIRQYVEFLTHSDIPKCLLYAVPGLITPMDAVAWAKENFSNLTLCDLGHALHYAQESHPRVFSKHLKQWYQMHVQKAVVVE